MWTFIKVFELTLFALTVLRDLKTQFWKLKSRPIIDVTDTVTIYNGLCSPKFVHTLQ